MLTNTLMTLFVKGDPSQAVKAAQEHGLEVKTWDQTTRYAKETRLTLFEGQSFDAIIHWFAEPSEVTEGLGYPIGTLLHYSYGA